MSKNHYVDNKQLYAIIVEYKQSVAEAEANGDDKPQLPDYVGHCLWMIANRLATKPNFANYSYKDEMVCDGIENCITYFDNFDPSKTNNPFAYFTQIIYYAFLRRIQKEKKQLYIKHKVMENSMILNTLSEQHDLDDRDFPAPTVDFDNENMFDFIRSFEDNLDKKRTTRKKGLEKFLEDEQDDPDLSDDQ